MASIDEIASALNKAADAEDHEAATELAQLYQSMQEPSNQGFEKPKRLYEWSEVPEQFVKNLPSTGGKVLEGIADMVVHPIDTASHTAQLVGGELRKVLPGLVNKNLLANPEDIQKSDEMANAVNEQYAKDYGSLEGIKRKLAEDPAGFLLDVSTLASGAGAAVAKVPRLARTAQIASKVGKYTNPLEIGLNVGGKALSTGYDILSGVKPKVNAGKIARAALGPTLESTLAALRKAPQDLTAAQAAYGSASPLFATLGEMGAVTDGVPYLTKDLASQVENRRVMQVITPDLKNAAANEAQVITDRTGQLTQGQDVIDRSLANQVRRFEAGTTKGSPQAPLGTEIVGRREALKTTAKAPFEAAYNSLFEKYPKTFSLAPVYSIAKDILSDLKTKLNPDLAKGVITRAESIFGPSASTLKTEIKQLPKGQIRRTVGKPATETFGSLADMHYLLSEIKSTERALGNNHDFAQTAANLKSLKAGVEDAMTKGLSKDALAEYQALSGEYKSKVIDPFYTGTSLDIARNKRANRAPLITPENITSKYLTESGANEFNRTFGSDPKAIEALSSGIEQQMLNATNPEKFIADNRFALSTLSINNPTLVSRLEKLAEQLRVFKGVKDLSTAERKLIPEKVAAEVADAPSAANQARVLRKLNDALHPSTVQENAAAFLSKLNNADLSSLTDIGQLGGVGSIETKLLRNIDLAQQGAAGKGAVRKIWDDNTFMQRLPAYLNPIISTTNKALGIAEKKIASATERAISKGMLSPKNATAMLKMIPADERVAIISALRKSATPFSKIAPLVGYETNQQ